MENECSGNVVRTQSLALLYLIKAGGELISREIARGVSILHQSDKFFATSLWSALSSRKSRLPIVSGDLTDGKG